MSSKYLFYIIRPKLCFSPKALKDTQMLFIPSRHKQSKKERRRKREKQFCVVGSFSLQIVFDSIPQLVIFKLYF